MLHARLWVRALTRVVVLHPWARHLTWSHCPSLPWNHDHSGIMKIFQSLEHPGFAEIEQILPTPASRKFWQNLGHIGIKVVFVKSWPPPLHEIFLKSPPSGITNFPIAQEQNTMILASTWTQTTRSWVQHANHLATVSPTVWQCSKIIVRMVIILRELKVEKEIRSWYTM